MELSEEFWKIVRPYLTQIFQLEALNHAFGLAENETAEQFGGKTCSLVDKDGNSTCPICFFRIRVKHHLGFGVAGAKSNAEELAAAQSGRDTGEGWGPSGNDPG